MFCRLLRNILPASVFLGITSASFGQIFINFSDHENGVLMTWTGALSSEPALAYPMNEGLSGDNQFYGTSIGIVDTTTTNYYYASVSVSSDASYGLFGNPYGTLYDPFYFPTTPLSGGSLVMDLQNNYFIISTLPSTQANGSALIANLNLNKLDGLNWQLDVAGPGSLHISAIPEPSTYALLMGIFAVMVVGGYRFHARRKMGSNL